MLSTWGGFTEFLIDNGCELIDESDWGYPIYRRKGNGKICGLDLNTELDDFMICAICHEFMIEPPNEHDHGLHDLVKGIKKESTLFESEQPE